MKRAERTGTELFTVGSLWFLVSLTVDTAAGIVDQGLNLQLTVYRLFGLFFSREDHH